MIQSVAARRHATEFVRLPFDRERALITFSDHQIRQLLSLKPRTFNQWRVYVLMAILLDTGCRRDEVIKLPVADVDMQNLLVTVYGKWSKEREIPFSFEFRKLLFRYGQSKDKHGVVLGQCSRADKARVGPTERAQELHLLLKRLSRNPGSIGCVTHTILDARRRSLRLSKPLRTRASRR